METLPLPDVGTTLTQIAGLSPNAQLAAIFALSFVVGLFVWTRRPQQGPDAATVVETMRVTAQALTETSSSVAAVARGMDTIAQSVGGVAQRVDSVAQRVDSVADDMRAIAEDMRNLTHALLIAHKEAA